MKTIKDKDLKYQCFKVLVDIISKTEFESNLYKLVEDVELKSDSLLFNLVTINYVSKDYKKHIELVLKSYCSEVELLAYNTCSTAQKILITNNSDDISILVTKLSYKYVETDYGDYIFYPYFILNEDLGLLQGGYGGLDCSSIDEVVEKAKVLSKEVLKLFKIHKEYENWNEFLDEDLNKHLELNSEEKNKKSFVSESSITVVSKRKVTVLKMFLKFFERLIQ
jgi:hypothetical protein